jgi:acetyltransferase-like isoleucine patch superfamily enzyme
MIKKIIAKVLTQSSRLYNRIYGSMLKSALGFCGKNVVLHKPSVCSNPNNMYLYDNTSIMKNWTLLSDTGKFIMKDHCIASTNLVVITGNHNRVVEHTLQDSIANRLADEEKDVVLEEEVWLGTNVTLLPGITIGRGTTVAAGSVVNRDLPPYTLCAGIPAKVKKVYWTAEQIMEHERAVYPPDKRKGEDEIKELVKQFSS